jgi:hypothetical protein
MVEFMQQGAKLRHKYITNVYTASMGDSGISGVEC